MNAPAAMEEIETFAERAERAWAVFDGSPAAPDDRAWVAAWLKHMYDLDQEVRNIFIRIPECDHAARKRCGNIALAADRKHREALARWLDGHQWPRRGVFGDETCMHAWMIAVHADLDPAFLRRIIGLMEPLLHTGEVDAVHYAALVDRLAIVEGRGQRFGMFYKLEGGVEVPYPVDDADGLAARRAELGLGDAKFHR